MLKNNGDLNKDTNTQLNILILGAGLMQHPVIFAAKLLGLHVIVADGNEYASGVQYADEFWHIDLRKVDSLVEKAKISNIHAVLTCATDFSFAVARIAEACSLPGISSHSAEIANYKNKMRKVLFQAGVAVPKSLQISKPSQDSNIYSIQSISCTENQEASFNSLQSLVTYIIKEFESFPLVIKPTDNMGARGVCLARSIEQLSIFIEYAISFSTSTSILVEQYLSGCELSIDSFIQNEVLYPLGIADRHIHCSPYFVETGHNIPSQLPLELQKKACNVLSQAAKAAGITNGICKGDIIFHNDQAYIGEFAARLSGGYMSGWTIPYSVGTWNGLSPTQIALKLSLNHDIPINKNALLPQENDTLCHISSSVINPTMQCIERAIFSIPGLIRNIQIDHTIYLDSRVRNIFLSMKAGDTVTLPKNNPQKLGSLIISTKSESPPSSAELIGFFSKIIIMVEANKIANEFLFASQIANLEANIWRDYPEHEIELQNPQSLLTYLESNPNDILPLPIYVPDEIIHNKTTGIWSNCEIIELIHCLCEQGFLVQVTKKEHCSGGLVWSALLRGGLQGFHYLLQLIQECRNTIYTLQ